MQAELYTWTYCPFCVRAKKILDEHNVPYEEHVMDTEPEELKEIKAKYGHSSVPIVLLDGKFIGGCDDLEAVAKAGGLKA